MFDAVRPTREAPIDALSDDGGGCSMDDGGAVDECQRAAALNAVEKGDKPRLCAAEHGTCGERSAFERAGAYSSGEVLGSRELLERRGRVLYVGCVSQHRLQFAHRVPETGVARINSVVCHDSESGCDRQASAH